jgi:capsid protein
VLVDARGRPAFYIVGQDADSLGRAAPSRVAVLPAEQIVHVFEPSRAGQ